MSSFGLMSSLASSSDYFPCGYDESWGPRNLSTEPLGLARGPRQFPDRGRYVPIDDLIGSFPDPLEILLSIEETDEEENPYPGQEEGAPTLDYCEHESVLGHPDYAICDPEDTSSHEPVAFQSGGPRASADERQRPWSDFRKYCRRGPHGSNESHVPKIRHHPRVRRY